MAEWRAHKEKKKKSKRAQLWLHIQRASVNRMKLSRHDDEGDVAQMRQRKQTHSQDMKLLPRSDR